MFLYFEKKEKEGQTFFEVNVIYFFKLLNFESIANFFSIIRVFARIAIERNAEIGSYISQ